MLTGDNEFLKQAEFPQKPFIVKPLTSEKLNRAIRVLSSLEDHLRGLRKLIGFSPGRYLYITVLGLPAAP